MQQQATYSRLQMDQQMQMHSAHQQQQQQLLLQQQQQDSTAAAAAFAAPLGTMQAPIGGTVQEQQEVAWQTGMLHNTLHEQQQRIHHQEQQELLERQQHSQRQWMIEQAMKRKHKEGADRWAATCGSSSGGAAAAEASLACLRSRPCPLRAQ